MALQEIECPRCQAEFEAKEWESGECPKCGNGYLWDEECTGDYSDCWAIVLWEATSRTP
jgi:peptide subunit release factor 1 (eRF1)